MQDYQFCCTANKRETKLFINKTVNYIIITSLATAVLLILYYLYYN